MIKKSQLIFLISVTLLFFSCRKNEIFFNDTKGNIIQLDSIYQSKTIVLIFLAPECPLSENYASVLSKLNIEYKLNGVNFFGVISGKLYSPEESDQFHQKFKFNFPILMDTSYYFANKYKGSVTPEVIFIGNDESILYRGAIDNWAIELTKLRTSITEFYLKNAIENYLSNKKIEIVETKPIGCYIER